MQGRLSVAVLVLAMVGVSWAPLGGAQLPEVPFAPVQKVSLGFVLDENFDDDNGGFVPSPVPPPPVRLYPLGSWAWGAPSSGPGFAASGSNVWATNLTGTYEARECAAILSPPIDLAGVTAATVSVQHWIHTERLTSGTTPLQDAGRLFVTTDGGDTLFELDPTLGYNGGALALDARRCFDDLATGELGLGGPTGTTPPASIYSLLSADLTPFAGQTVQVLLSFASSSVNHRAGWYVDDFTVTRDAVAEVEDFEAGDGGFTLVSTRKHPGPAKGWDHGVAANGGPNSTSPLWATNTQGHYGHDECASLDSPAFQVGDANQRQANEAAALAGLPPVAQATLRWNQWFNSNSIYAAGLLFVGTADGYEVLTPDAGYPGTIGSTVEDKLLACLGVDAEQRVFSGSRNSNNTGMTAFSADLTPWVGENITLRLLFASGWGPLNPTTNFGWYVDDVSVEMALVASGPDAEGIANEAARSAPDPTRPPFPGWVSGGAKSSWGWGVATNGPAGTPVFATNLTGNYHTSECSHIDSPPVVVNPQDPVLRFDQWYRIESVFSTTAFDGGVVLVSADGGLTWQYLDSSVVPYTRVARTGTGAQQLCLASHGVAAGDGVFAGAQTTFQTVSVDLAAYAGLPVRVRFAFASDTVVQYEGWYLKNVQVGGVPLLP